MAADASQVGAPQEGHLLAAVSGTYSAEMRLDTRLGPPFLPFLEVIAMTHRYRLLRPAIASPFSLALLFAMTLLVGSIPVGDAHADGTETLGPPSIPIASGSGIVAAGTGLYTQPGTIEIDVPGNVVQVLLYWECMMATNVPGDNTISVDGTEFTGTLIGGPTFFFRRHHSSSFRADITAAGLVSSGPNTLTVEGLDCTAFDRSHNSSVNDGAGILVIYDDGTTTSAIGLRDGNDLAHIRYAPPLDATVPQTFTFTPEGADRDANLTMFVASVDGLVNGEPSRPSSIEVTFDVGGTTTYSNLLTSNDGPQWDTIILPLTVPAGASSMTVEVFSRDDFDTDKLEASLVWIGAGLSVPVTPPDGGCTYTWGYWKTHSEFGPAPYDDTWGLLSDGASTPFFGTGLTYYDIMQRSQAGGNKYIGLAHQYIAAELNVLSGASIPPEVLDGWLEAQALLIAYEGDLNIPRRSSDRSRAVELEYLLDQYNMGEIGPGHCDDDPSSRLTLDELRAGALAETPASFSLEGAYPTPFNPSTNIRFTLSEASPVHLEVFDVLGRSVRVLAHGDFQAGTHAIRFDASSLPSGTYLYRLETPVGVAVGKMVLMK
jgi:hypothetical protein